MNQQLKETIKALNTDLLSAERINVLQPLIDFVQNKVTNNQIINLNFICTHNSRRSHLAQIWAQVASVHFKIPNVNCFSGGTEETALYKTVIEVLQNQGFTVNLLNNSTNPIYALKFNENCMPIIGFSKKYNHEFNPKSNFAAVMTCSEADGGCPFVAGAEKRIAITYQDPKVFDELQNAANAYTTTSLQIATEMFYVFSKIKL
ncbi:protein-tyrosine-phosphatase [Myroides sp. JBRI-B21084]|uniref:arsenate-mycothiol transferase ArsC n=1 Tax=Myroides sp. JBRI-B21084 TaxID=3119977 RepID=UPI0026E1508F|nr:protein-tyrosine-phosphatase [Paenimyroides cloacae]WKW45795.1 protein-tyrosine-phosphatase [Paenimyroides cloacae]